MPQLGKGQPAPDFRAPDQDGNPVETVLEKEARRPFDLGREAVLRTVLISHGPEEHALLMVAHHIGFDFWSLGLVLQVLRSGQPAQNRGEGHDRRPPWCHAMPLVAAQRCPPSMRPPAGS